MAAVDTLRDALYGNPPSASFKPSRDGVLAAFEELIATMSSGGAGVASLAALAALPISNLTAVLTEIGKQGSWIRALSASYSSLLSSDTLHGISIVSSVDTTYCWLRIWDGVTPKAEWFGAKLNNGAFDSYAACQACLDVTGILIFPRGGSYYGSRGLLLPDNAVVRGQGSLFTGYTCSHATDHLMRQRGVSGVSYAAGADLQDFALVRTPNPTTPGSSANDNSQGHGLHFFMVSNPRVRSVYTYNNLAEVYVSNCLSPDITDIRGIRQTGTSADRWYGLWVDGVTGGGTFGGPSPNPSATFKKPSMVSLAAVGTCYHYYLKGALQDLWIVDPEAAGQGVVSVQFFLDIQGAAGGDVHIISPIADGYKTNAINVKGAPFGSSIIIENAWVAPNSAATSTGVVIDASHGVKLSGRSNFAAATGLACVTANDCTGLVCDFQSNNSQTPFSGTSINSCNIQISAFKNIAGGGGTFGNVITLIGGSRNRAIALATISPNSSPQLWVAGVALNNTAANCLIDVTGIANGAATNRVSIAGSGVSTQGNVSGHVIINPGAGAML